LIKNIEKLLFTSSARLFFLIYLYFQKIKTYMIKNTIQRNCFKKIHTNISFLSLFVFYITIIIKCCLINRAPNHNKNCYKLIISINNTFINFRKDKKILIIREALELVLIILINNTFIFNLTISEFFLNSWLIRNGSWFFFY
jgi:hypothetical protein